MKFQSLEILRVIPKYAISSRKSTAQSITYIDQEGYIMFRNLLSQDLFAEINRLQHVANQVFDPGFNMEPSIRGLLGNRFPAINVGTSPQQVEIQCFVPGIDPDKLEIKLQQGVLSIAGERKADSSVNGDAKTTAHINVHISERFAGRFHRVVSLPDDIDGNAVTASYRDGVLKITAPRREAPQPRRISIQ